MKVDFSVTNFFFFSVGPLTVSHSFYIYDMFDNKQQNFTFFGYFNGMVYDKKKEMLYISAQTDNSGGILCYEKIDGINSLYDYDL